ncbi:MAG: hypothetical protein KAI47_18070 [Deltaproteobacteria bacterium]|nr:hypothetical protein [Deltaproteobacteria bacterium]
MSDEKKGQRMSGRALQIAARLMETPGSGALLYRVASKQLGLAALRAIDIPEHVPPYRPTHLGRGEGRPIVGAHGETAGEAAGDTEDAGAAGSKRPASPDVEGGVR